MTDAELAQIEKACAEAMASSDLRFTAPWVFTAVPALLADVRRLKEENRKLHIQVMDWEARVRSERETRQADVAREREECAKVAASAPQPGSIREYMQGYDDAKRAIAAAIRSRGDSKFRAFNLSPEDLLLTKEDATYLRDGSKPGKDSK